MKLTKKRKKTSASSTSSTLSTLEIEQIINRLRHEQHRSSTRRNYYAIWKLFNEFFIRLDSKPANWTDRLTLYVGHLIKENKQSSMVRSYVSAIKAVLKMNRVKIKEDQYLLASLTKACKLRNDTIRHRFPIRGDMLTVLLNKTKKFFYRRNQPYLSKLYRAMLSTAYFGLLRLSEITTVEHQHPILARDVQVGVNKRKMLLILRSSKTHNKGMHPQLVKIASSPAKSKQKGSCHKLKLPCPYKILDKYMKAHGGFRSADESLFVFADNSPVQPQHFSSFLKTNIKKAGFNEKFYGTHSIHAGRCCDLYSLGVSVETIKKLGRWRSNAVFKYLKSI